MEPACPVACEAWVAGSRAPTGPAVIEVVDDDQADTVFDRQLEFFVALGVAVQHQPARIGARLERSQDFTSARDVEVQTLFDHHSLNSGARERL